MRIGEEGDTRKFRGKPTYSEGVAAALEVKPERVVYCRNCGLELGVIRKNWDGYCIRCFDEPL